MPIFMYIGSGGGGGPPPGPIGEYRTTSVQAANQNSYTFTNLDIGAADAARIVLLAVQWRLGASDRWVGSATVNGNAMTEIATTHGANQGGVSILAASIPTGTTATFVVTANDVGVFSAMQVATYRVVPSVSTPLDSGTAATVTTAAPANIEVKNGGFLVCAAIASSTSALTASYNGTDTPTANVSNTIEAAQSSLFWSVNTTEDAAGNDPGAACASNMRVAAVSYF